MKAGATTQRKSLLFVSPIMPAEAGNGLSMRAGGFLEAFAQDFDVTLLVIPVVDANPVINRFVKSRAKQVHVITLARHLDPLWRLCERVLAPAERIAAFAAYPRPALCRYATSPCHEEIAGLLGAEKFDVIHVMRSYLVPYMSRHLIGAQRAGACLSSLDLDDDEPLCYQHIAALLGASGCDDDAMLAGRERIKYQRQEAECLGLFQLVMCGTSAHAARVVDGDFIGIVTVVSNTVSLPFQATSMRAERDEKRVLFVGNLSYFPNIDAVRHFVAEVLPRLSLPTPARITFRVVGSAPPPTITALARTDHSEGGSGVEVIADVADVAPHYRWADLVVVPIRAGSGTRIKLLEAFSYRVPVVSTPLGAAGLDAEHGKHLLRASSPTEFADACNQLLRDRVRSDALATQAFRLVCDRYTRAAGVSSIRAAIHSAMCSVATRLGRAPASAGATK